MRSPRLVSAVLAASAVIAVSGCDSGSTPGGLPGSASTAPSVSAAAYRHALHAVARQEARAQRHVQRTRHAHLVVVVRAGLARFARDQVHVASELIRLHPPADAAAANVALAKAFADNARAVRILVHRLAHVRSVRQAFRIIKRDAAARRVGRKIDAALRRLKALGYTSGS